MARKPKRGKTKKSTRRRRKYMQEELARLLSAARKEANMKQVAAAKLFGISQSYLWKMESGKVRLDFVDVELFARMYGKPLDFFETAEKVEHDRHADVQIPERRQHSAPTRHYRR